MAESRDVDGGIEIGIVLKKHELELVDPLFVNGLKDYEVTLLLRTCFLVDFTSNIHMKKKIWSSIG